MKISEAIKTLEAIKAKYGDLVIGGAYMSDDTPLASICVVDAEGGEIWPNDVNHVGNVPPECVFLSA